MNILRIGELKVANKKEKKTKVAIGIFLIGVLFILFTYGTKEDPNDKLFSDLNKMELGDTANVSDDLDSEIKHIIENEPGHEWPDEIKSLASKEVEKGNIDNATKICSIIRKYDDRDYAADACFWEVGRESGNYSVCENMVDKGRMSGCLIQALSKNFDAYHVIDPITIPPEDVFYYDDSKFVCEQFPESDSALADTCQTMYKLYSEKYEEDN